MSVSPLDPGQLAALVQRRVDLAERLALGQIVRVQVQSREPGGRYLVRVLGEQALVESRGELSPGEELDARVTALDERIELERLPQAAAARSEEADEVVVADLGTSRSAVIIEELFRRYRASLRGRDAQTLERAVARAARPDAMALAGLVLRKAGLPVEPGFVEPLYGALTDRSNIRDGAPGTAWSVAQRILNVQGGGSVSHQIGLMPIRLGGRTLQAEFAFFEESRKGDGPEGLRHRKAVLVLDLAHLGRVEARAVTAGEHLRVVIASESPEATAALLRHAEALLRSLAEAAWQVDEIRHETRAPSPPAASGAVAAAVEHLITPGSVSRRL